MSNFLSGIMHITDEQLDKMLLDLNISYAEACAFYFAMQRLPSKEEAYLIREYSLSSAIYTIKKIDHGKSKM